ncbi:hypothetical protein L0Y65_02990 [Candidatus Micrarchaeota archaeon]|nr:hypothetical protein [Candidatus Micrarchaeota archaeon]
MRNAIILILAAVLLFGCAGGGQPQGTGGGGGTPQLPGTGPAQPECTPSYAFSELEAGTLSETAKVVATVTCADGKTLLLKVDGNEEASVTIGGNATQPQALEFYPKKVGTLKVTIEDETGTLYSRDWSVNALGSEDISGLDYDGVSFKEWRAMAMDVQNPIAPDRVRIFMKRIAYKTQKGTEIVVDIRRDDSGSPGGIVASVKRPINATTLTDNWINFDFDAPPSLAAGKYWVVVRIEQSENVNLVSDVVNVHYVGDKNGDPNTYTRQMLLDVDMASGMASETSWQPLSYDRTYSIMLTKK